MKLIYASDGAQTLEELSEGDLITFDTDSIWDQRTFLKCIPKVDWDSIIVTDEQKRKSFLPLAESLARIYHDSSEECALRVSIDFPWQQRDVVLKLVHEIMPLHGFFAFENGTEIILRKHA